MDFADEHFRRANRNLSTWGFEKVWMVLVKPWQFILKYRVPNSDPHNFFKTPCRFIVRR